MKTSTEPNRALRRHHAARLKRATRKIGRLVLSLGSYPDAATREQALSRWVNRTWKHRKACSCDMCRNPRTGGRTKGKNRPTIAERRARLPVED